MIETRPLASIKKLIHQPLPLTTAASQQLLKAITTSFRRNLDREHGFADLFDEQRPVSSIRDTPAVKTPSFSSSSSPPTHKSATDEFIRSILTNPLLSYYPIKPLNAQQETQADCAPTPRANRNPHARAPSPSRRNPINVFDEAVAKGLMTLPAATGCLLAVFKQAQEETQPSPADTTAALARSRMGSKVVGWLRRAGYEDSLHFIHYVDPTAPSLLAPVLVHFLVAEQHEERVWGWIDRLLGGHAAPAVNEKWAMRAATMLLQRLVAAKCAAGDTDIAPALQYVTRAEATLAHVPSSDSILLYSWRYLVMRLTGVYVPGPLPKTAPATFDTLLGIGGRLGQRFITARVLSAQINLHHPTAPTCEPAMKLVSRHRRELPDLTVRLGDWGKIWTVLVTDTVMFLERVGQDQKARTLLESLGLEGARVVKE